jgi:glutamyl-Q tRNA(Asp) synthetase
MPAADREARMAQGVAYALRLDGGKAAGLAGATDFTDRSRGVIPTDPCFLGDAVLARKDIGTSYHLSVVVDDAAQGVTLVTRGEDLFPSTHLHRLLQELLGMSVPDYHHHPLITDDCGERFAKRSDALSLRALRTDGVSPAETRARAGFPD